MSVIQKRTPPGKSFRETRTTSDALEILDHRFSKKPRRSAVRTLQKSNMFKK